MWPVRRQQPPKSLVRCDPMYHRPGPGGFGRSLRALEHYMFALVPRVNLGVRPLLPQQGQNRRFYRMPRGVLCHHHVLSLPRVLALLGLVGLGGVGLVMALRLRPGTLVPVVAVPDGRERAGLDVLLSFRRVRVGQGPAAPHRGLR